MRHPHRWSPEEFFSKNYIWALIAARQDMTRPEKSHSSYETFNLAVRDGCFICNAVLEDHLAQSGSETCFSLEHDFVEIQFVLERLPRVQVQGFMACLLKFSLVLHSSKSEVDSASSLIPEFLVLRSGKPTLDSASRFMLEINKGLDDFTFPFASSSDVSTDFQM